MPGALGTLGYLAGIDLDRACTIIATLASRLCHVPLVPGTDALWRAAYLKHAKNSRPQIPYTKDSKPAKLVPYLDYLRGAINAGIRVNQSLQRICGISSVDFTGTSIQVSNCLEDLIAQNNSIGLQKLRDSRRCHDLNSVSIDELGYSGFCRCSWSCFSFFDGFESFCAGFGPLGRILPD